MREDQVQTISGGLSCACTHDRVCGFCMMALPDEYSAEIELAKSLEKLQAENAELKEKNMALSKQTAQASCLANEAIEHAKTVSKKLGIAKDALLWAYEMFLHRDHMNAKVHCAPERLSPITERCKTALASLESKIKGEAK